jgi:hypothetical protein
MNILLIQSMFLNLNKNIFEKKSFFYLCYLEYLINVFLPFKVLFLIFNYILYIFNLYDLISDFF